MNPTELSTLFEPYVWEWFSSTFDHPSPPQVAAWPTIARGQHTLIFSPTGSGKTLAAFLWCINELFKMGRQQALDDVVYVLYISPLKALNNDIQKNLVQPLQGIQAAAQEAGVEVPEVRSAVRTGDTTRSQRAAMSRRPPHILITTPESLYIILSTAKFREAFRQVKYVIVDEIHAISDNKRGVHLSLSLERLQHLVGDRFVRIGLSATQNPLDEIARFLVGVDADGQPRPCHIVDAGARKNLDLQVIAPVDNLLEAHFDAIWGSAYDRMLDMVCAHETTLVFTNSRYKTERTALRLNERAVDVDPVILASGGKDRLQVGAHHGSMSKKVRLDMENQLKSAQLDALVATSSLELGIDVGSIDLVCQVQSPKSVSSGMQRIGRAGHLLDATSKGRLLVTDRDDLVESTVLVRAIVDGQIETTRVPMNCLDVLSQHIVGAVAADPWHVDDLFALCRHAYCYHSLDRADYDRVLDMLSGGYTFDLQYPPYAKVGWDKVNRMLYPEPSARLLAFQASGTIPDVSDYDVYFEARKTVVGRLGESFVEELHGGDIFILGSSSWRVLRIHRNRVFVEDVYGRAPTIPFWFGDRPSRTYDLGVLVGQFRREMIACLDELGPEAFVKLLQAQYFVNEDGALSILEYLREQQLVMDIMPSDRQLVIERFVDELGQQQIIVHSPFGIRVNDPWSMALRQVIEERYSLLVSTATIDDGILITVPKAGEDEDTRSDSVDIDIPNLLHLVSPRTLDELLEKAVFDSPLFKSRFRHNAVRSMMVLRAYKGRRTPVWLQGLRSSDFMRACIDIPHFPLITETLRECMHESLDVPNLRRVIEALNRGEIEVFLVESRIPSPFVHSLLLLGQYGEIGSIPTRERRGRLMHLHRELLRQILDEETLRHLLDEEAVREVEDSVQRRHPKRARNAQELARILLELGDLVESPGDELSLHDRVAGDPALLLDELVDARRAVLVSIPTVETNRMRWIATENFPLYRDAFAVSIDLDAQDQALLDRLARDGPLTAKKLESKDCLERLVRAYRVLRVGREEHEAYVAADTWVPEHIRANQMSRQDARQDLVFKFARWHGPFTKYEVMERYGWAESWVETALANLVEQGTVVQGEYVPFKSFPQWCYRPNLEQIHRLTLKRLRKEMEPASPAAYADFLVRWQHRHPDTRLAGLDGLCQVLRQIQGQENYQIVYERDLFFRRVKDYDPAMLDRLCYGGEVIWRRFSPKVFKRGQIGFVFRADQPWLLPHPDDIKLTFFRHANDDIPEVTDAVRQYLRENGASFFDDIVAGTGLDWRLVLRSIWRLVWEGQATNDSYESIRYADVASGLSACYDLATHPGKKGVTLDLIVRHILDNRHLDPRLGHWSPTERLVLPDWPFAEAEDAAARWANLLLDRYGVVCKETLKREVSAPKWKNLRKALVKQELLGQVRRGFFVEGLSGEQYATQVTVDLLREAKLRQPENGEQGDRNDLVCLNLYDPANPFGFFFPLYDEGGETVKVVKTPTRYLILQGGRPVLLWDGGVRVLADLPLETAEAAIRLLMDLYDRRLSFDSRKEISIRSWNSHPIDVSPARHLLFSLGFNLVDNRWRGCVYAGLPPHPGLVAESQPQIPALFERQGKEKSPVVYDADWIVSRAEEVIRPKLRELLAWFEAHLPPECSFVFRHHYGSDFMIRYRGMRCINPHIQRKKINLHITHRGWVRPIEILPDTDLDAPGFVDKVMEQFNRSRAAIDELLDK